MFDYTGLLKEGNQKLHLYSNVSADAGVKSTTNGETNGYGINHIKSKSNGAYYHHITKALEAYRRGKVERLKWLDDITLNYIEHTVLPTFHPDNVSPETKSTPSGTNDNTYLYIGLPYFDVPVIYEEMQYFSNNSKDHQWLIKQQVESMSLRRQSQQLERDVANGGSDGNTSANGMAKRQARARRSRKNTVNAVSPEKVNESYWKDSLNLIVDPDLHSKTPNPAEVKYRRLARGILQKGYVTGEMNLKPNRQERERLENIFKSHKNNINALDREILWKFRHGLVEEKRALTKFLLTIDFGNEHEVNAAKDLLPRWKRIDVADALLLLGQHFENNYMVRRHAISILDDASDEEIDLFMLQLVQAMRYEPNPAYTENKNNDDNQTNNIVTPDAIVMENTTGDGNQTAAVQEKNPSVEEANKLKNESLLSVFLIDRAVNSFALASSFYWYLRVEKENQNDKKFTVVYNVFLQTLKETEYGRERLADLERQSMWLKLVADAKHDATTHTGFGRSSRDAMLLKLKKSLHAGGKFADMLLFDPPVISPLDTRLMFAKIVPDKTLMFKSKIYPVVYTFEVEQKVTEDSTKKVEASSTGKERRLRRQRMYTLHVYLVYFYILQLIPIK